MNAQMGGISVVHITLTRNLSAGQRMQLQSEAEAGRNVSGGQWQVVALNCARPQTDFEKRVPFFLRPVFLRSAYAWFVAFKLSRKHDFVLLRHMTFDPFVFFFAPFISNRLSVHHAKEVEELPLIRGNWKGRLAARIERWTGPFGLKRAAGILGVTHEITNYELGRISVWKPSMRIPNGIDVLRVKVAADNRKSEGVQFVFICETFSPWHGLDRLIDEVDRCGDCEATRSLTIHLIGNLNAEQIFDTKETPLRRSIFQLHGRLTPSQYAPILSSCDLAIASLAMDRQNLSEGSTLKVREMLAMGLPIYATHIDTAIPSHFPFFKFDHEVDLIRMVDFAKGKKAVTRSSVRDLASQYIDKRQILQSVLDWLKQPLKTDAVPKP